MMTVTIDICGEPIIKIHAVRIKGDGAGCVCTYKLYDDKNIPFATIDHNYDRGAEVLATMMINNYMTHKEVMRKDKIFDEKQMRFCDVGGFKMREA